MRMRALFVGYAFAGVTAAMACTGDDPSVVNAPGANDQDAATTSPDAETTGGDCKAPLIACGELCVDLETSTRNCGRCSHDCGAQSTCSHSLCQPVTLAKDLDHPAELALGARIVIVKVATTLVRCPKEGCLQGPGQLYDAGIVNFEAPKISTDGDRAFFFASYEGTANRFLMGVKIEPDPLEVGPRQYGQMLDTGYTGPVTDAREHYMPSQYRLRRCLRASGCYELALLHDGEGPGYGALTSGLYVWTHNLGGPDAVYTCPRPDADASTYDEAPACEPVSIANRENSWIPGQIAVVNDAAYWVERNNEGFSRIRGANVAGADAGDARVLVTNERIDGFAADESGVYWTSTTGGTLKLCADLQGGCPDGGRTLVTGETSPSAVALDAEGIFFLTETTLERVTK